MTHRTIFLAITIAFTNLLAANEELPHEIKELNKMKQAAEAKITAAYVKKLKELQTKYTKRGDLDNALLVKGLIDEHAKENPLAPSKSEPIQTKMVWTPSRKLATVHKEGIRLGFYPIGNISPISFQYKVDPDHRGDYKVSFKVAAGKEAGSVNPVTVSIDGEKVTDIEKAPKAGSSFEIRIPNKHIKGKSEITMRIECSSTKGGDPVWFDKTEDNKPAITFSTK